MRRPGPVAAVRGIALAAAVWATSCLAISPATVDQIVCSADVIVEATVTVAKGTCEAAGTAIRCTGAENALLLDLRIDRVLARKDAASHVVAMPGATIAGVYVSGMQQFDSGPLSSGRTLPFGDATRHSGVPEQRRIEIEATSDDAARVGNAELRGRPFVFTLSSPHAAGTKWFARMWPIDGEANLLDLVKRTRWPGCATVVEDAR